MKTIRKKFLIISILIVFLILFIIIGNIISNKSYVSVTTFKKSYNYLTTINDDNEEMEVLLYITNEKASFTDINKINNCKLYDDDTEININLSKITNLNYSQNINGSVFHLFSYIFSLPKIKSSTIDNLKENYEVKMEKAFLLLGLNNYDINVEIGSFYYLLVEELGNKDLSISKLKPIVNIVNTNKTLVGLNIGFTNNTNKELLINKIELLENGIYISSKDIKENTEDFQSSEEISKLLGYKYNCLDTSDSIIEDVYLVLDSKEITEYIIPIKYKTNYPINSCGLMVTFTLDGIYQTLYFDDFLFFKDNTITYPSNNITILEYEDR